MVPTTLLHSLDGVASVGWRLVVDFWRPGGFFMATLEGVASGVVSPGLARHLLLCTDLPGMGEEYLEPVLGVADQREVLRLSEDDVVELCAALSRDERLREAVQKHYRPASDRRHGGELPRGVRAKPHSPPPPPTTSHVPTPTTTVPTAPTTIKR